jgi:hypothetical protein
MGSRKLGIQIERLLVVGNGRPHALDAAAIPVIPALQVRLVGLGAARSRATEHVDLIGHELHRERPGDVRGDVCLQVQRFSKRTVVGLCPEMHFRARLDELRRDADPVAVATHTALEQVVGRELAPDLAGAFRRSLEQHR